MCRDWTARVAYCDAAIADADSWEEETMCVPIRNKYGVGKKYNIELKPLFSAFRPRAIGATTIRAVLVNYLPLIEAYLQPEDDEFEEDLDRPARPPMDPVVPLKRSVTHIFREVSSLSSTLWNISPFTQYIGLCCACIHTVYWYVVPFFRYLSSPHDGFWKG